MADNETKVKITGDSSGAEAAMARAAVAVSSGATTMRESMNALTSVFEGLQSKMVLVAGVLAGGKAFKESIDKVVDLTKEATQLSNALGISASEANVLNTALGNVFLDKDTYIDATKQITKQLNSNSDAFKQMGIATKDAQGNLLPMQTIISNTATSLQQYKAGVDRNVMANQLLGRSYEDVLKIAKLTPQVMQEAADEVKDYQKQLDPTVVMRYNKAMENVGDVFEGIKIAIGQAVMPALTMLAEWFGNIGPTVVREFRVALLVLQGVFFGVATIIRGLVGSIQFLIEAMTNVIAAAIDMGSAIAEGNWGKAKIAAEVAGQGISESFKKNFDAVKDYANEAEKSMKDTLERIQGKKVAEEKKPSGGNLDSFTLNKKEDGAQQKTRTGEWALEIANLREKYELENNLRKLDLQKEIDFWQEKIALTSGNGKEYQETLKKLNDVKLKQMEESSKNASAMAAIEIEKLKAAANSQLAIEQDNAKAQLDLGQINNAQYLQILEGFEQRRYDIARVAMEQRIELAAQDPNQSPAQKAELYAQMEALEQDHAQKVNQINIEQTKESGKLFEDLSASMSSLWDKGIESMMNGTLRWKNAYKAILAEIGGVFLKFAADKAKAWLQTEILQTAYTKIQTIVRSALVKAGVLTDTTATVAGATTKIGAEAAAAGAGAAASQAPIPIVGPALAVAAMAAMLATVGALKGSIKSARGGYDIPAGVNPMVQLHEQEMVLPKEQANTIRNMSGQSGQATSINLHVHAMDAQDVKRLLMNNSPAIAEAMKKHLRNGGVAI